MSGTPRRIRRGVVASSLAAVLLLTSAGLAVAEPRARITQIRSVDGEVVAVLTADGLAPGEQIDPTSVAMTVNGQAIDVTATPTGDSARVTQAAVLTIDASESMAGDGIRGAKEAALAFLDNVPEAVPIGLISFAKTAEVRVPPTTDRATLRRAVNALETQQGTAVYDALALALDTVRSATIRTVILLSDGRDTASQTSFDDAVSLAGESGTTVDTVALGRFAGFDDELAGISAASGGRAFTAANASDLAVTFAESASSLSNQVLVRGPFPNDLADGGATVSITADAAGSPVSAEAFVTLSTTTVESGTAAGVDEAFGPIPAEPPRLQVGSTGFLAGLAIAVLGLFVIIGVAVLRYTHKEDDDEQLASRLALYSLQGQKPVKEVERTAFGTSQAAQQAVELARQMVRQRDFESTLETRLEAAGVPLRPAEWIIIHVGAAIAAGLLLLLVSGFTLLLGLLGVALGTALPWVWLSIKKDRRHQAFYDQLPDTLQLLASSLSAGYSLPQAMDTVVREGVEPIAGEFGRSLIETRLGVPPEDALEGIAHRMESQDFLWVVMAIRIQREVGGNLAELLTTVAATLRERAYLQRQVRVLSAEGRLSAWIVGSLPVAFALFLLLTRPELLEIMWTDIRGIALLILWAVLMLVGVIWLRRVVRIEV